MFRSGFVAMVGRPNVGKSTLLNRLIGQKVAITSPVVQTTRHRIKGVVTSKKGQIIFFDTPGFSKPLDTLGTLLTQEGSAALSEADILMMVVDLSLFPGKGDTWVAEQIRQTGKPVLMVLNKRDRFKNNPEQRIIHENAYKHLFHEYPLFKAMSVSALTGKNSAHVTEWLLRKLPEGPAYYDEDSVTDQRLREIAAEIIREKVLLNTSDEIPHSVAVGVENFEEADEKTTIDAVLYVDQDSQKGIVIGKQGQMLKTIGTQARKDLETLCETSVRLNLHVKVKKNWRKNPQFLKSLGLAPTAQMAE